MRGTLRPMGALGCVLTAALEDVNAWEFRVSREFEQIPNGDHVAVLQVDVHATAPRDAERLAAKWGITGRPHLQVVECEDHGPVVWRSWVG